jgi:hypothetical protein
MKSPLIVLASLCALLLPAFANTIDLPKYGFSIEALDADSGNTSATPLILFLPGTEGFAPNINVNIQPFPQSMKDYATLSRSQFEQMKWKIITEKMISDTEWMVEYQGPLEGNDLHFYARAVAKNGKVYLTTGSAKETQWATSGPVIRKHVDSFKLK